MSPPLSDADVLCEMRDHIAVITLNRPAALNALTFDMIADLQRELQRCAQHPQVQAVLLRGAGDKAFCAGGDIRALYQSVKESGRLHHDFFVAEYALDYLLYAYPKPCIALLDGITMGGGMGIAQGAMLRVVGERTRLAMPEVGIGLFPDVGASYFLSRLAGGLGPYFALTGVPIRGVDAVYSRLADVFLTPAAIASLADDLDDLPWSTGHFTGHLMGRRTEPGSDPRAKVRAWFEASAAGELPAPALAGLRPAIDSHFSRDTVAAILESLDAESRAEYADWARQTAKLMRTRSPTMLTVALRQLQRGKSLDLAACFRMELGMVEQCFEQGDFIEGVRALLIDKDNAPQWKPSRLQDVTAESVDAFFRERWPCTAHPLANLEMTPSITWK